MDGTDEMALWLPVVGNVQQKECLGEAAYNVEGKKLP